MARGAALWEEPPISGEDGSGTISSPAALRCVYCQNASIALGDTPGRSPSAPCRHYGRA
ncbi:MAG: hypothetical protein ACLUW6_00410 [Coriobacteriaceae bacterium]